MDDQMNSSHNPIAHKTPLVDLMNVLKVPILSTCANQTMGAEHPPSIFHSVSWYALSWRMLQTKVVKDTILDRKDPYHFFNRSKRRRYTELWKWSKHNSKVTAGLLRQLARDSPVNSYHSIFKALYLVSSSPYRKNGKDVLYLKLCLLQPLFEAPLKIMHTNWVNEKLEMDVLPPTDQLAQAGRVGTFSMSIRTNERAFLRKNLEYRTYFQCLMLLYRTKREERNLLKSKWTLCGMFSI